MKRWIFPLMIVSSVFLQTGLSEFFRIFGASPDLFLVCVVASSFFLNKKRALLYSFLCGILKDLLDIHVLGIHTLSYVLISLLLAGLSRKLSMENSCLAAFIVFLSAMIYAFSARLMFSYTGNIIPLGEFWRVSALQAVYTALVFYLFFGFLKRSVLQ